MGEPSESLRALDDYRGRPRLKETRVIAVASGKGGVGKTSLSANLALVFGELERNVLAIDGDLGLANLDIAFGLHTRGNIMDVLNGTLRVEDVLAEVNPFVSILPACSGRFEFANMGDAQRYGLFSAIDSLEDRFDLALIDTAAGIGANTAAFSGAAQTVVLVATADPTSLADAYACVKVLAQRHGVKRVCLVANAVRSPSEGEEIHRRVSGLVDRFLNVAVDYLGHIPRDSAMDSATRSCVPVVRHAPSAPAAEAIRAIARRLLEDSTYESNGGVQLFWKKVLGVRAKEAS